MGNFGKCTYPFQSGKETFEYYDKKYMQQELYFTEAAPVLENNQLLLGTDIGILKLVLNIFRKVIMPLPLYSPDLKYKEPPRI